MRFLYRKQVLVLWFISAIAIFCTACTSNIPTVQNIEGEQQLQQEKPIEIVISHSQNIGTPEDYAAKSMQHKLQELLGEQARVILYADYQMGSSREQLEAVQLGRIHITIQPVSVASQFLEDLQVLTLPYLFPSDTLQVQDVLDSSLGNEILERIALDSNEKAYKGLGLWFGGHKLFTFHGDAHKLIQSPADFCGLTIALPDASILKAQYQRWGAKSIAAEPIALYSILAQRIADGTEATAAQIVSGHLHEVQSNVVQAYHSAELYTVLVNRTWFDTLSADWQKAVLDAEEYGKEMLYKTFAAEEAAYIACMQQTEGLRYEVLEEKEIDIFKASVQPLYEEQLSGSAWQMDYAKRLKNCFT